MRQAVDTKASKGRRLRFAVHPKLQHFMAPQPLGQGSPCCAEVMASLFAN